MANSHRMALLALILTGGGAWAQTMKPSWMDQSEAAARRFPQPVRVDDLIHRAVLQPLESQPVLGHVEAVVRLSDGKVDIVVRYGGFLGFGGRLIAVPVDAMVLLGDTLEIVDFTPDQLDGFPTYAGLGATPVGLGETIKVGLARPSH